MESPASATESSTVRPPPLVIHVPPPERLPFQGWTLVIALVPIIAGIVIGLYILAQPERAARLIFPPLLWSCALFIAIYVATSNRRYQRRRSALCCRGGDSSTTAEPSRWTSLWRSPLFPPTLDKLIEAAHRSKALSSRAVILCVGFIDPPAGNDFRFEPEVIPTTKFLWKRALPVPVFLLLFGIPWCLQSFGILRGPPLVGTLTYPVGASIGLAVMYLWRAGVRPTYIRLAPRMVQIMRYGMRSKKPEIRGYAMEAGTIVIVSDASGWLNVHLAHGDLRDTIPLSELRKPGEQLQRIWPALLSTAPTPPLSDEELLG